jgi:hypothetical protein
MWLRCVSIVFGLTNSWAAASRLVAPSATTTATCSSCGVSSSRVSAARRGHARHSPLTRASTCRPKRRRRGGRRSQGRNGVARAPPCACGRGVVARRSRAASARDRRVTAAAREDQAHGGRTVPPSNRPRRSGRGSGRPPPWRCAAPICWTGARARIAFARRPRGRRVGRTPRSALGSR